MNLTQINQELATHIFILTRIQHSRLKYIKFMKLNKTRTKSKTKESKLQLHVPLNIEI